MPFVYGCTSGATLSSSGTPSTELVNIAVRQVNRGVSIQAVGCLGRGAALTSITGIGFRVRRWTTAGSGGTALTPAPRFIGTTAASTVTDSQTTITAGTVSGAYQLMFGCGAAGPGGWVAPNPDSVLHLEGGGSDEFDINSITGGTSLTFELSTEIVE